MTWRSVRVRAPATDRDAVIGLLFELGSGGVHEEADSLVTHFSEPFDDSDFTRRLHELSAAASVELGETPEIDWTERWRDRIVAHEVGRLTIAPPWLASGDPSRMVVIDPGMAFGTGDHPTTRGIIRLMHGIIAPGDVVADLGAGSGVLAIAAARLGATRVAAIEIDPDAISNAEENVARNGVGDRVTVIEGDAILILPLIAPVQVVVANIVSSVITRLLPLMRAALPGEGTAIIGGILLTELDRMAEALGEQRWSIVGEDVEGEWWSATIRPD